ncbi:MAG: Asp-tRNA(Asn)/Glu-tRNA(Gln) amidotransferase subunit GatB [Candidatus Absconditabacteria bacterium]|nr:Asp-tRNA(Asn)/Glu-tRNA(Gln) amidotransferase subunit GatB [Candidatus Absconditabacteria bacterium]
MNDYILTIGLEIHLKLKSENKLFCQCKNQQDFENTKPNTNICPVCTGQPGALPTLSQEALYKGLILGKALNCSINKESSFDRKSYFYPDLPMGYQITQLYHPTNTNGKVNFYIDNYRQGKTIHILDAHLESDTAKMIHENKKSILDFNRAGTPLIEVVTGPDFCSSDEVIEFLKELQRIVRFNNISDADMEKGQMRVDVNISIKKENQEKLGTRVEIKNINSFGSIKRAIENEFIRQKELYESNQTFSQQTRRRDDQNNCSHLMRSKEEALDYRYFPEPDLPPLILSDELLENINNTSLEIPYNFIKKAIEEYGFNKEFINALITDKETLDYFLSIENIDPKIKAKRICGPIAAWTKENYKTITQLPFSKENLIEFLTKSQEGKLIENQLKDVLEEMLSTSKSCNEIIKEKGFDSPGLNENELENIIKSVLTENPTIVEQYKGGKTTTLGFFVGQVMKKTGGKTNPKTAGELIQKLLGQQKSGE